LSGIIFPASGAGSSVADVDKEENHGTEPLSQLDGTDERESLPYFTGLFMSQGCCSGNGAACEGVLMYVE